MSDPAPRLVSVNAAVVQALVDHAQGGMVLDAIRAPMGVVPDSCAEVYAEYLRAERGEA